MNRRVLITGASRGIGKAVVKRFAKEQDILYLICRNSIEEMEQEAVRLQNEYGCQIQCFQADVSDAEAFLQVLEQIPQIDVLVNNAGISYVGLLTDMSLEEWNQVLSTNLSSMFLTAKKFVPGMVAKQSGRIINISSVWGNVGASMEVAYSASKGGVNSFTKALAKELAPSNIQVNAIACGMIDTDMNACFSEEEKKEIVMDIPADRIGKPEEVADLVHQLSVANTYLTGQIITMDGGWI